MSPGSSRIGASISLSVRIASLSHRLGNAYGNPVFLRETTYQWALDAFVDAWNDYHHCMAG